MIESLKAAFKRPIPNNPMYHERLKREFELIEADGFVKCFFQVIEILEITKNIPHIIRGSSGSSLVCYL